MLGTVTINQFDLRPKLIMAFVLVALLVGVTGVVGSQAVSAVDAEAHTIAEDADKIDASMEMLVAVEEQQVAVQAALLGEDGTRADIEAANSHFEEWAQQMEGTDLSEEERGPLPICSPDIGSTRPSPRRCSTPQRPVRRRVPDRK